MNPLQGYLSTRHALSNLAAEHLETNSPQAVSSQQLSRLALPTSIQVGAHTFHIGRLMTTLSDRETELLHGALRPGTDKKLSSSLGSDESEANGLFTYSISARDCFSSSPLAQRFPINMDVSCNLDHLLRVTRVRIGDARTMKTLCDAHFDPYAALQVRLSSFSEQRPLATRAPPTPQLQSVERSSLTLNRQRLQMQSTNAETDSTRPTRPDLASSVGDTSPYDQIELPPMVPGELALRRQQRLAAAQYRQTRPVNSEPQPTRPIRPDLASSVGDMSPYDQIELPPMVPGELTLRRQQRVAATHHRPTTTMEARLRQLSAASATPLESLSRWEHDVSARPFEQRTRAAQRIRDAVEAAERIRHTSRSGLPLDLGHLQLTSIPNALSELLPSLKVLHLDDNRLTSLSGLDKMNELEVLTVDGNRLSSLDSLPPLPRLEMLRAYANPSRTNGDFEADQYPRLRSVHPRSLIVQEQRERLTLDDHSDGWSLDSDARMQDQEDFVSPISEAARRWNTSMPTEAAESHAASFYRQVVPNQLHQRLQTDLESRALLTLCAGVAFTADALSAERGPTLKKEMLDDLSYLSTSGDANLMEACQEAADGAVNRCGDRVSYGWSKVHQQINLHRMIAKGCTPLQFFDKLDGLFQQKIVEDKAFFIASKRAARESVSIYLALAKAVQEKDVNLPEVTHDNIFANRYPPTEEEVEETLSLINNRRHNPAKHDHVTAHPGMQHFLREFFAADYSAMLRKRSLLQSAADDVLEVDERLEAREVIQEAFGDKIAHSAVEQLERSGKLEWEWYQEKVDAIFADPKVLRGTDA